MDMLCASLCRGRLLQIPISALKGRSLKSLLPIRALHLSLPIAELSKPKVKEDESPAYSNEDGGVKGHRTATFIDQDEQILKERYHGNLTEEERQDWTEMTSSWRELPQVYLKLSKSRLTTLVVLTALGGYCMAPGPFDSHLLLWTVAGTAMCSAAANSFNQWMEVPYDSQMARTRNRVLVRGKISSLHASLFGATSGLGGVFILWNMVNPLTASLGLANMALYTLAYTPLKRISIVNTWVGAVVGAIPPLMGWAACMGTLQPGAMVLAGILYSWQFAHFNALSWGLRGDYSRAGYRMMAVTDPALCRRVALRYSIATIPICAMAPLCDLTTWFFVLDSLPVNFFLVYLAWNFYRDSDYKSARRLFQYSLLHLPVIMALIVINKKKWYVKEKDIDSTPLTTP